MHEVIERFRYRFDLWRRERREDLFGPPRSDSPEEPDYLSNFSDTDEPPKVNVEPSANKKVIGEALAGVALILFGSFVFERRRLGLTWHWSFPVEPWQGWGATIVTILIGAFLLAHAIWRFLNR